MRIPLPRSPHLQRGHGFEKYYFECELELVRPLTADESHVRGVVEVEDATLGHQIDAGALSTIAVARERPAVVDKMWPAPILHPVTVIGQAEKHCKESGSVRNLADDVATASSSVG